MTRRFRPVARDGLAATLAELVLAVHREHPVRVAVDGPEDGDAGPLADELVDPLRVAGRPVLRIRAADFLRPRSIRHRRGRADPEGRYEDFVDTGALLREVLLPLGPGGSGRYLPTLWDADADRATRAGYAVAPPRAVVVVDGPYLLRPELVAAFDLRCHLDVSEAALLRRAQERGADTGRYAARELAARRLYIAGAAPAEQAHVVVRIDDPRHPAVAIAAQPVNPPGEPPHPGRSAPPTGMPPPPRP